MSDNENTETVSTDDELTKIREALKNANAEAATNRHKVTELQTQLDTATNAATKYKASYMNSKINEALKDHGATNPKIGRVLDYSKIDLDESGELVGFDEQLTQVKEEFPEFFDSKRRAPSIDAADKRAPKKPMSSAERLIKGRG